jgi:hypothetical protein
VSNFGNTILYSNFQCLLRFYLFNVLFVRLSLKSSKLKMRRKLMIIKWREAEKQNKKADRSSANDGSCRPGLLSGQWEQKCLQINHQWPPYTHWFLLAPLYAGTLGMRNRAPGWNHWSGRARIEKQSWEFEEVINLPSSRMNWNPFMSGRGFVDILVVVVVVIGWWKLEKMWGWSVQWITIMAKRWTLVQEIHQ